MSLVSFRRISTMANNVGCSPFSRAVFSAMRKLYPEELADKSFDNTGLLLEAPFSTRNKLKNSVLLTIDLTSAVAQEAIEKRNSVIVTYHPIIFRGLKHLNLENSQQRSLLRLAAEGISVYSPHTAVDAAVGGNADWMADIITGELSERAVNSPSPESRGYGNRFGLYHPSATYELFSFPRAESIDDVNVSLFHEFAAVSSWQSAEADTLVTFSRKICPHTRSVINPNPAHPAAGNGRIVQFSEPRPLSTILEVITAYFRHPRAISIACAYGEPVSEINISAAGICAGSGGSVLGGADDIDLLVTGEISHHEALAAVENGKTVITFSHSNSERGYLAAIMRNALQRVLREEWTKIRDDGLMQVEGDENGVLQEMLLDSAAEVEISERDRDPFETAIWSPGQLKPHIQR